MKYRGEYGEDARCIEFASCGPKNYGYRVQTNDGSIKNSIKVKGIRLISKIENEMNFDTISFAAKQYTKNINFQIKLDQMQIRCSNDQIVKTLFMEKSYRAVSSKRKVVGNNTLPFGYVDPLLR